MKATWPLPTNACNRKGVTSLSKSLHSPLAQHQLYALCTRVFNFTLVLKLATLH